MMHRSAPPQDELYHITSRGINQQGNAYNHRYFPENSTHGSHYSNRDPSWFYNNPDGLKYYTTPNQQYTRYTAPSGYQKEYYGSRPTSTVYSREQRPASIYALPRSHTSTPSGYNASQSTRDLSRTRGSSLSSIHYQTPDGLQYWSNQHGRSRTVGADGRTLSSHSDSSDEDSRSSESSAPERRSRVSDMYQREVATAGYISRTLTNSERSYDASESSSDTGPLSSESEYDIRDEDYDDPEYEDDGEDDEDAYEDDYADDDSDY
ncbi:hypothetical protein DL96DRAFT_1583800 [Flagelloscypha sp. PMI_526]|nr:hypothetical protein DL96DRAFT_1583800 [Flagelloscypha sp. PMI_526]